MRAIVDRCRRSPLFWILAATAMVHVIGIGWGLPSTDGWDNDGVAPRDCLAGIVETFIPGHFFTYPPVHLLLLSLLTSPVTLVALVKAKSLAPADVVHEIIKVPYMTTIAYVARVVTVTMSVGIVWALAKIGETIRGPRAGLCVAVFAGVNWSFAYYAHTTNLDVPYLFWSSLAVLALVRAIAWHAPKRLRTFATFAVLAIATKDQAYAIFLLGAPVAIASWLAFDPWARDNARAILREVARSLGMGIGLLLVADAILFNPTGFVARLHFLAGAASQEHALYSNDWIGRFTAFEDTFLNLDNYYPSFFGLAIVGGIGLCAFSKSLKAPARIAAFVPLACAFSFTLAFNCTARRTEHRFLLPQSLLYAVYGGIAIEPFLFSIQGRVRAWVARGAVGIALAVALFEAIAVDANLELDPRYDAETWMAKHVAPADTIEVHGLNVYLPRFPSTAHVVRVGPDPIAGRNPLPPVEEVQDAYGNIDARKPKWILLNTCSIGKFLVDPNASPAHGRVFATSLVESASDRDATSFFGSLLRGQLGYVQAHLATWRSPIWPRIGLHAAVSCDVWIMQRTS